MLQQKKSEALRKYKEAKKEYCTNVSSKNWIKFCDAKRNCMLIG